MNKPYYIKTILDSITVTELLSKHGIEPKRISGTKSFYLCPFHKEKTPSFCVSEYEDYEWYKCFGCGCTGDAINLHAELNNQDIKHSIVELLRQLNVEFSEEQVFEDVVKDILNGYLSTYFKTDIEELALKSSRSCKQFLDDVNNDPVECEKIEEFFKKVDDLINNFDDKKLEKSYDLLISKCLPYRKVVYDKKQNI